MVYSSRLPEKDGIDQMKILNSLKIVLLLAAVAVSATVSAAQVELADNHPVDYTVVEGDTLWDISGKFLRIHGAGQRSGVKTVISRTPI